MSDGTRRRRPSKHDVIFALALVLVAIAIVMLFTSDDASSKPTPKLTLTPSTVRAGESATMRGSGLAGEARFSLFATIDGKRARVGWAKTDTWGRFKGTFRTVPGMLPGRFELTVCRRGSCAAEHASATLRVTR